MLARNPVFSLPSLCFALIVGAGAHTYSHRGDNVKPDARPGHHTSATNVQGQPKPGGVVILECGKPRRDGEDSFHIRVRSEDGTWSDPRADAVTMEKDLDPAEKAQKIKEKIEGNNPLKDMVSVSVQGHVVTISAKPPYTGVSAFRTSFRTAQIHKHKISYPPTGPLGGDDWLYLVARFCIVGVASGLDPDGLPSVLKVGTDRWVGTWWFTAGESSEAVMDKVLPGFLEAGITAVRENAFTIKILVDPDLDGSLYMDCSDANLDQWTSFENSPTF